MSVLVLVSLVLLGVSSATFGDRLVEHCRDPSKGSLVQAHGSHYAETNYFRVKNLVIDRNGLELMQPTNEYKPAGSKKDTFQMVCESSSFDFNRPIVNSHGLSSDNRPFGTHFIKPVQQLPKCDVSFGGVTVMFNRDWFRNLWHRVANDLYPAYVALAKFGLLDEKNVSVLHLDWSQPTFQDMYELVSPNMTWLKDMPKNIRYVCLSDTIFMVSRPWYATFPENGPQNVPLNPRVQAFGEWVKKKLSLDSLETSFKQSGGKDVTVTWISRTDLKGNRAIKNEDAVIANVSEALGSSVMIQKTVFEKMTFREQVAAVATTDILFGMHGAGFTHILWMPRHAVVLEVLPMEFDYLFYERVARICGIKYVGWVNDDRKDMVDMTWEPHTKFSNLILRSHKIVPKFREAINALK